MVISDPGCKLGFGVCVSGYEPRAWVWRMLARSFNTLRNEGSKKSRVLYRNPLKGSTFWILLGDWETTAQKTNAEL